MRILIDQDMDIRNQPKQINAKGRTEIVDKRQSDFINRMEKSRGVKITSNATMPSHLPADRKTPIGINNIIIANTKKTNQRLD